MSYIKYTEFYYLNPSYVIVLLFTIKLKDSMNSTKSVRH